MASQAPHGTRTRYVRGCRCDECTEANRDYSTRQRNRRKGLGDDEPRVVTAMRGRGRPRLVADDRDDERGSSGEWVPGETEVAVLLELKMLSASQKQPGLVQGVIQMARILDSPKLATAHPTALRQMAQGLEKLRSASAGRSGRLASVAALSRREVSKSAAG